MTIGEALLNLRKQLGLTQTEMAANSSHYYWSRRSGNIAAAKALKNFVGSDCDWHQIEYGCEMNRNLKCRGLSKHPKNCSSFSSKWHHTNWSVRLHWRSSKQKY